MSSDSFDLQRFVAAQEPVYARVVDELRRGRKTSHWMWFIFPQLRGLGRSSTAEFYGVSGLAEAAAYLAHPVLGPRLRECTALVSAIEGSTAHQIFGDPDDLKFRSSMTLFAHATPENAVFLDALQRLYGGSFDPRTIEGISSRDER